MRDSKQMTPAERESAAERIHAHALAWCVGFASSDEIDTCGIVTAGRLAAMRAVEGLRLYPDALLTDFRLELPELDIPQAALVKGDARCLSIAAASVLAKTARDALMRDLDAQLPGYGLAQHKGYGTSMHRAAIIRLGMSPIHRRSFTIKYGPTTVARPARLVRRLRKGRTSCSGGPSGRRSGHGMTVPTGSQHHCSPHGSRPTRCSSAGRTS